jgi:hypothetical protein
MYTDLHDRAVSGLDVPHHSLVYLERILGRLLEENGIRDSADISFTMVQDKNKFQNNHNTTYPSARVEAGGLVGKLHLETK